MKKKSLYITSLLVLVNVWTAQAGVQGALPGAFSVSATKKVYFSQGNLQYQASTKTWRFAEHQYDFIGSGNQNISYTYSGWIDLFGYGTSGWNSGATYYLPTSTSTTATGYLAKDLSGSYANADWGIYNAISNGGNKAKTWRTLTYTEWNYIFKTRANATNLYSVGTVNSKPGLILLPDGWVLPSGLSFTPKAGSYSTNTYSTTQWTKMANAGAVFLPAAGWRALKEYRDTYSGGSGKRGCYQTASYYSSSTNEYSYFVNFYSNSGPFVGRGHRNSGLSVRLVVDVPTYTITWTNWDGTTLATISVLEGATPSYTGATPTRPSTAEYAYTFSGWTPAITAATANKTYTATYTATPRYTITFNANGGLIPTGGNMGNTPSGHITTLSADRTSGTVVVTKDKTHFENMANDCPSREGYTFAGWYTDPTSGVQVYDNTGYRVVGTYWNSEGKWIGTSNVTLYAHWSNVTYTITFVDVNENTIGVPQMVEYGQDAIPPAAPTREGYTFAGWIGNYTNVKADATIYATYYKNSEVSVAQQGALDGIFSVSPTEKVLFSQGNLQYHAMAGTHVCADASEQKGVWRFAEQQYDTIGVPQKQKAETYAGWISTFGWGTSGWNSGANIYQPWVVSGDNYYDYYPGGDYSNDLTGAFENADWGVYNAIFNGGNIPRKWRTLSKDEWQYILKDRPDAEQLCSFVKVKGIRGMILLPDNFVLPDGVSFTPGETEPNTNYSESEWLLLEQNGAVFLPMDMQYTFSAGNPGWGYSNVYYTSTHGGSNEERHAYAIHAQNLDIYAIRYRCDGGQVRVVCAVPPVYTITVQADNTAAGTATGAGSFYQGTVKQISATPNECYRFVQWSDGNTDNPRTITVTGDATYTAEFEQIQYTIEAQSADTGQGSATVTNP